MEIRRAIRALLMSAALCSVAPAAAHAGGPEGPGGPHGPGGPGDRAPGGPLGHGEPELRGAPRDAGQPSLDQDKALEAVRSSAALPLDQIVVVARRLTQGQIVDAELSAATGPLLYRLTVLEPSGEVRAFYFQADTGRLVRVE